MKERIHYAWIVAVITFGMMLAAAAVRSTPSILMVPLEHEFGWDRATISVAASVNILLFGLIGPFAAGFMNRFGLRRMMVGSLLVSGSGVLLSIWMKQPLHLILTWGVLVGVGSGMSSMVLGATVVNRWFHTRRGLLLGALTAANATGQLLFLPLFAHLVESRGWRSTAVAILCIMALILPIVMLFMRNSPADVGQRPWGLPEQEPYRPTQGANPFRDTMQALMDGLKSRDFWLLAGSFFVCGASTNGLIGTHLVPACMDHGITEVKAASLLAVMGIFDLLGTTGSGWLSDRFDNRKLLFTYYGLRGLSLLFLPSSFQNEGEGLNFFAVFYGLDWIATVPPTVALATKAFGRERGPIIFGWIAAAHQVGASCAAYFAGFLRSTEGHYDHAFMISGSLCLATAIAVLAIGRGQSLVPRPAV